MTSRRSFIGLLAAAPAVLLASQAHAFKSLPAADVPQASAMLPAGGLWETLVHATDGTNPSTAITTELPRFTPAIRALDKKPVTIAGYLLPVASGFGRAEYILSQYPFHCGFCYGGGRASLMVVTAKQPLPESQQLLTLSGTLHLQESAPDDYYYQLHNAVLA